jgi:hypothetical protein
MVYTCRFSGQISIARIGWAIFQLEALELAGQSAYIRSRSRNTKILSTFSTGQRGARNER